VSDAAAEVSEILAHEGDADDVLRAVVSALAERPDVFWAGIAFVEDGVLRLGPAAGLENEARRMRAPVSFQGATVGEVWVDGTLAPADLERVAGLIAPLVLIGWDTDGEAWEP
jgi:putative methionine-R-sulfoxide reductase with GAF domain